MMSTVNRVRNILFTVLLLLPLAVIELSLARPITAQTHKSSSSEKFGGFFAPKGEGMPKHSQGGASRGTCLGDASALEHGMSLITLLTPQSNIGFSAAARPVFLAHIEPNRAKQVYFSLKNEDESYFYDQTLPLSLTSTGMLKIQLPDDAPALEVGEQYRWSVALICGNRLSPDSPWASGLIERTDAQGALQPEVLTPMEQASAYGRAGIWYDTVASLFSIVEEQSSPNAQIALNQLLEAEELSSINLAL